MQASTSSPIDRRTVGADTWLSFVGGVPRIALDHTFKYNILDSEAAVGQALLDELIAYSKEKTGDIVFVLLGGRGAQAMYRLIAEKCETGELDDLLARLHVFTQDALAPMRMAN